MHTALDDRHIADRTNRIADLAEDAAIFFIFFSGVVIILALVAAFVL